MKYESAQINRLGNRDVNEDRFDIVEHEGTILMVLADGMGGHTGGDLAAQVYVSTIRKRFSSTAKPIADIENFIASSIVAAHQAVISIGNRQTPPIAPRTTGVIAIIQNGMLDFAHIGDSRLYLIRNNRIAFRTRDNSYVERLFQKGKISEDEMMTHPKRHHLSECIGGDPTPPMITRGRPTPLKYGDVVLMCSDGLWGGISEEKICTKLSLTGLEDALEDMAQTAEHETYPISDNISVIAVHWQQEGDAVPTQTDAATGEEPSQEVIESTDKLDIAIDEIERTIKQFESEMKK